MPAAQDIVANAECSGNPGCRNSPVSCMQGYQRADTSAQAKRLANRL